MRMLHSIVSFLLMFSICICSLSSCSQGKNTEDVSSTLQSSSGNTEKSIEEQIGEYLFGYADLAYENIIRNYWTEYDCNSGHFLNSENNIFWEFTMVMLGFETLNKANGNADLDGYIKTQFAYWMERYKGNHDWITYAGGNNNPSADDAAWTSMAMILFYNKIGDTTALELCRKTIKNAYEHWGDPEEGVAGGLYYRVKDKHYPNNTMMEKTLYAVGLIYSALRYHEITVGTKLEDKKLYNDTIALYNWIEKYMLRDSVKEYMDGEVVSDCQDMLYYVDFKHDRATGEFYPSAYNKPLAYRSTSLFGNMGMACIHRKLFDMTGDEYYLERAVETANSIAYYYNYNGTLLNDRDAWTNCAFLGYFVTEVMTLEGVDRMLGKMLMKTVYSIMNNCYYDGGYYGGEWNEAVNWLSTKWGNPMTIMINANTTHVIYAAALAYKLGLVDCKSSDLNLFKKGHFEQRLTDDIKAEGASWINYKKIKDQK